MRFVDTNVLLYAASLDPRDAAKQRVALDLLDEDNLAASVQVYQEFYFQATRLSRPSPLTHSQALEFLARLRILRILPITLDIFHSALTISQRFQISYWDAAILAAARALSCDAVYSEDLNPQQNYDGLLIINPFATLVP